MVSGEENGRQIAFLDTQKAAMLDFNCLNLKKVALALKRIGIFYNPLSQGAFTLAEEVKRFLGEKGVTAWLNSVREKDEAIAQLEGTELIISIGGDGTILRASQVVVPKQIPILGVNLGRLGFMTELGPDEVLEKLPALLSGEGWIDERSMLEVELPLESDLKRFYALNDVVVGRGSIARLVYVEASIDDKLLTTYRADGVLVATATGSTGYSLAAGGPILHPQASEFLLLPLLPHLSSAYPLVLPSDSVVRLRISTGHEAVATIDGHVSLALPNDTLLTVKISSNKARFLRIHPADSFYATLEQKLRGR